MSDTGKGMHVGRKARLAGELGVSKAIKVNGTINLPEEFTPSVDSIFEFYVSLDDLPDIEGKHVELIRQKSGFLGKGIVESRRSCLAGDLLTEASDVIRIYPNPFYPEATVSCLRIRRVQ